ncbi:MAG: nicotinamide-nucleotide amidase [Candidatus Sedimenticola sp. (ex Thyasira tokunagai)]
MRMDRELEQLAKDVGRRLALEDMALVTAESCTGGWIAKVMTDIPGSSGCFDRGFVTYSNEAKQEMLGVSIETLERYGAVSETVVQEMVVGALKQSRGSVALSVSGIAGPGGGSADKPVGTVCFAWGIRGGEVNSQQHCFEGDRESVRRQAVSQALQGVLDLFD